jgi:hypothetical protein
MISSNKPGLSAVSTDNKLYTIDMHPQKQGQFSMFKLLKVQNQTEVMWHCYWHKL